MHAMRIDEDAVLIFRVLCWKGPKREHAVLLVPQSRLTGADAAGVLAQLPSPPPRVMLQAVPQGLERMVEQSVLDHPGIGKSEGEGK